MKPINITLIGKQIIVTIDATLVIRSDKDGYISSNIISDIARANGVHIMQTCSDIYYFNGKSIFVKNDGFKTVEEVSNYIKNFCYPIIEEALIIHEVANI